MSQRLRNNNRARFRLTEIIGVKCALLLFRSRRLIALRPIFGRSDAPDLLFQLPVDQCYSRITDAAEHYLHLCHDAGIGKASGIGVITDQGAGQSFHFLGQCAKKISTSKAMAALEHAKGFLKHELASRLNLRRVPDLYFSTDAHPEAESRVDFLLRRAKRTKARD